MLEQMKEQKKSECENDLQCDDYVRADTSELWETKTHTTFINQLLQLDTRLSEVLHMLVLPLPWEYFLYF